MAFERSLAKNVEAPALARGLVRDLRGEVRSDVVADAALLVSELVSNGVKYGGDGEIQVHIEAEPDRLRAEIVDQGNGFIPRTRDSRHMTVADAGGWGLHLVETLADDWGVHTGSTHVWFEIRRD